jgi:hypothetical protein
MSWPNLWFLPRAFFTHGGHGGGKLPAFPAPSARRGWNERNSSDAKRAARTPAYAAS